MGLIDRLMARAPEGDESLSRRDRLDRERKIAGELLERVYQDGGADACCQPTRAELPEQCRAIFGPAMAAVWEQLLPAQATPPGRLPSRVNGAPWRLGPRDAMLMRRAGQPILPERIT
jgi:hypothetical protein